MERINWVDRRTILRGVVGSTAHGLQVDDGLDDRDEMGVCVEPMAAMIGRSEFEQYIYRTAAEREGRQDAPSKAGDLDLTIYSLRKWTRLALDGNPTVLLLLFLPPELRVACDADGAGLQELAPLFASRRAGIRFLGYLNAQKQRMLGERGSRHGSPRQHLVDAYGYDTKYAMHVLRLGIQGVEFMRTGRLTLPIAEPERSWIRSVRAGKVSQQDVLVRIGELERELKDALDTPGPLPAEPLADEVWAWVRSRYLEWWKGDAYTSASLAAQEKP